MGMLFDTAVLFVLFLFLFYRIVNTVFPDQLQEGG